jgi:D-alanyl-D-alanine carboxypeptidase
LLISALILSSITAASVDPSLAAGPSESTFATSQQAASVADSTLAITLLKQRLDRIFTSPGYRPQGISARVMSLKTGRVLYERNPELPLTPASTTKLFTTASVCSSPMAHFAGTSFLSGAEMPCSRYRISRTWPIVSSPQACSA